MNDSGRSWQAKGGNECELAELREQQKGENYGNEDRLGKSIKDRPCRKYSEGHGWQRREKGKMKKEGEKLKKD